jgi:hypothetical protein
VLNSAAEHCRFPNFRYGYVGIIGYRRPVVTGVQRYAGARRQGQGGRQVDLEITKKIITQIKIYHYIIVALVAKIAVTTAVVYVNENSCVQVVLLAPVIHTSETDGMP